MLVLVLLRATGCRVAELVRLDLPALDPGEGERVVRFVRFGVPARDAVRRWLCGGRPQLPGPEPGRRCS